MKRSVSGSIGLSVIVFLFSLLAGSSAHAQVSKKYELRWDGGSIRLESAPGQGTRAVLELPASAS